MTTCTYVRRLGDAFEYGIIRLVEGGTKKEKREHFAHGTRPTMDDALRANKMALEACPRIGQCHSAPYSWK